MQQKELLTERLLLRELKESDASAISILRSIEEVNRYIARAKQTSVEEAKVFIAKRNADIQNGNSFYWALCFKDKPGLIGTLCMFNFSADKRVAELGYELSPEYQGKGIASEAVKAVIKFAFENANVKTIEACVHQNHVRSIQLLLKNGFVASTRKEEKYPDYGFFELKAM